MTDTYISIDLETTGLNPKKDCIIEIGALKVVRGQVVDTFSTFVNPGRHLEESVVEITGIHEEQLSKAPYIEEIFPKLNEFLEDFSLLGHKILFDYSFLKKAAVYQNLTFEKNGIDTLQIARKYLPDLEHRNLDFLCHHFQIEHHAHRALEDAKGTHFLYLKLAELFAATQETEGKPKESLFEPKPLSFKIKKDQPPTKLQRERLYHLLEKHKIDLGYDVERLTQGETCRFIDKIRNNPKKFREKYGINPAPTPSDAEE